MWWRLIGEIHVSFLSTYLPVVKNTNCTRRWRMWWDVHGWRWRSTLRLLCCFNLRNWASVRVYSLSYSIHVLSSQYNLRYWLKRTQVNIHRQDHEPIYRPIKQTPSKLLLLLLVVFFFLSLVVYFFLSHWSFSFFFSLSLVVYFF